MHWQDIALVVAGLIGGGVAVVHGVLTQRLMVEPFARLAQADARISAPIRRIVPPLLHLSTVFWFLGGIALIAAALWFGPAVRVATCIFVGALYLYGAFFNLWATRGRHPGWALYAVTLGLIAFGAGG